jgi:very-long-chain (3R)-3-hydroxyacyl-CoA dehydratase
VTSELSVIYLALPYVRQRKLYSIEMPNQLNFAFDCTLLICATAFGYIFGLPMLYSYMLHQRRTALSGKDKRE